MEDNELERCREQVEKLKLDYDNENYHLRTAKKIQEQMYNENVALSEQNRKLVEALQLALPVIHEYSNSGIYDRDNRKMVYDVETEVKKVLASISSAKQK